MDKRTPIDFSLIAQSWISWVNDPLIEQAGITFDRTPADVIRAPEEMFRVCAYHFDFDERPTCYQDVRSLEAAKFVCENISDCRGKWNVDYAVAYDAAGKRVIKNPFY